MTCKWCNDTKTMEWNSDERGCPPPPVEWNPNEEWDLMEASQRYNNLILLGNEPLICTIPCPVCIGFGRAKDPPYDLAYEGILDKHQPPGLGLESTPESRWNRMYTHLLAYRERYAAAGWAESEKRLALARQHWLKVAVSREQFRIDNTPDWPLEPDEIANGGPCPHCKVGNFGPTRHPRTGQSAIFCCECGMAWIDQKQRVPNEGDIERRKLEVAGLRHNLQHTFLLSPGEAEMLLSRHGFDLLDRLTRQSNNVHFT